MKKNASETIFTCNDLYTVFILVHRSLSEQLLMSFHTKLKIFFYCMWIFLCRSTFSCTSDMYGKMNRQSFFLHSSSRRMRISATRVFPPLVGRE